MNAPAESAPRSARARANGIQLHYLEWGKPDAQAALLLHGLRGHAHSWDDVSAALAGQYRVIALDQRGRGETDWAPDGNYLTEAFAADLEAFCDTLGLESIIVVGHSMGGRNSIMFAAQNPGRVAGLALVDVGPDISPEGAARIRKELLDAPEQYASLDAAVAQCCSENPLAAESTLRRRILYQTKPLQNGGVTWRYDPLIREQIRSNTRPTPPDFWGMWQSIARPILILRGSETDILGAATAKRMLESNSRAQMVEIPKAAHMVFEDNPREFIHALRRWMTERFPARAGISSR